MEIISSSEVHNGAIVVCWVLIMVRSDLAGMLVHSMFKLVLCGKTTSAWLVEFNLWPRIYEVIRKRKIMSTVRNEYITGNLQLNNSHCVDVALDHLSHTATKMLPGTVPAALERTFERLIQCLLSNRCSSPSWHCSSHWTTYCSLKTLQVHTWLELLWGEISSQDVLDCEKLESQSHITATDSRINSFCSENEAILGWKPSKIPLWGLAGLKMDLIHRNSWHLGSLWSRRTVTFLSVWLLSQGWVDARSDSTWIRMGATSPSVLWHATQWDS